METLEFSVFDHGSEAIEILRALLAQFKARNNIDVRLEVIPWEGAWPKLVKVALYRDGPDVSEIGSTWVGDFVHMNALRSFGTQEIIALGGEESFLPSSWKSGIVPDQRIGIPFSLWAVPWITDTRVVFYRKDLFEKAGIDHRNAFRSADAFEATLTRLKQSGVSNPLAITTQRSRTNVHILASWVWGAGGDFIAEGDGEIILDEAEARKGMKRYFGLRKFLTEKMRNLTDVDAYRAFWQGDAAVTIGGHWMLQNPSMDPALKDYFAVAQVPGTHFVGGFHLVVWQHTRKERSALQLIDFLAGRQTPHSLYPHIGLPARRQLFETADFLEDSNYKLIGQAVQTGRSFPTGQLWGLIESRLVDAIPYIWRELFDEEADIDSVLDKHLPPLVARIKMALK